MGLIIRMSLLSDGLKSKCMLTIDIYTPLERVIICSSCAGVSCQTEALAFFFPPSNSSSLSDEINVKVQRIRDI